jgi:hypothetical protein
LVHYICLVEKNWSCFDVAIYTYICIHQIIFTFQRMPYLKTSIPREASFAVSSSEIARGGGGLGGRGSRGKGRGEGRRGRERGRGVYLPCS